MARSKQKLYSLRWPLGGLDKRPGYQDQRPYTTSDCLNVWPTSQEDGRERGGSRPGLGRAVTTVAGWRTDNKINMLGSVRYNDSGTLRDVLVMACNGALYKMEDDESTFTQVAASGITTGRLVHCTDYLGKLYIAIDGHPKVYTPPSTLADMTETTGTIPHDCRLICTWNDRIGLAGAPGDAHNWTFCRMGDPTDWLTSALDVAAPIAGNNADAGYLAEPLNSWVPHAQNCLVMGCENSLWAMQGDPAAGGRIVCLSRAIGMLPGKSWAVTDKGLLFFMSKDGLYRLDDPCNGVPVAVSRERIPEELLFINSSTHLVLMEFDRRFRGLHIYISKITDAASYHYWYSLDHGSFWPWEFATTDQDPFAICKYPPLGSSTESDVMLGSRDGYVLNLQQGVHEDDSNPFDSYMLFGPVSLGANNIHEGIVQSLSGVLTEASGKAKWEIFSGKTFERAVDTTVEPRMTGKWSIAGLNYTSYPRVRGGAFSLKISSDEEGDGWSCEEINLVVRESGKRRGP